MPKRMHDTSMDRGFSHESISMNFSQLCAMNGSVYTPRRHRETLIFLYEGQFFVFQALDRALNQTLIEGLLNHRSRFWDVKNFNII